MPDPFDFSGRTVVVTGGSRGLGRAMALGFAERGASVIVASRDAGSCTAAVAEIEALGAKAWAIAVHVGRWDGLDGFAEEAWAKTGRVDVLVNNAGMAPTVARSTEVTETLFDKTVAVNFKGPFRLGALFGERMKAAGGGAIINVTSTGAVHPEPSYAVYAAAKGALNIITKAHALEFGPEVRVNGIMAGPFWTDIAKTWREEADRTSTAAVKRIGRPEEIVTSALYLASPRSSYTTGSILTLDGGLR
ncbi:MAG TPA: SDR family oxidoreductase [Stellaceae bacterium]|nr:SDR family oxidoreductase [Stellaceae bacterium]